MLNFLEESIYKKTFLRNVIPEITINNARIVLRKAYDLCNTLNQDIDLEKLYTKIDVKSTDACLEIATYVVASCILSCGNTWEILGNKYKWDIVPRIPQIAAALELCKQGNRRFAVQNTGEGKTITILIAIAILALSGKVHVITANDYLASRDYQWLHPVLDLLGIESAFLERNLDKKRNSYNAQIIFGSDKEFLFDYLRDSIRAPNFSPLCLNRENIIVDEGDHVLLDELMTPAIISKEDSNLNTYLIKADKIIRTLIQLQEESCREVIGLLSKNELKFNSVEFFSAITALRYAGKKIPEINAYLENNPKIVSVSERYEFKKFMNGEDYNWFTKHLYFTLNREEKNCVFTDRGMEHIEEELGLKIFEIPENSTVKQYDMHQFNLLVSLQNALFAHLLLTCDIDYIVRNSNIEVITSSIGRADSQKKFGDGIAGAVAVKEGVNYKGDSSLLTRITVAEFIKEYDHCVMLSGTLPPDHLEFEKIYNAKAFPVPTYKQLIVNHRPGKIFPSIKAKYNSLIDEVIYFHSFGRPVLIGTSSIKASEEIANEIKIKGMPVRLMNAKNESEESVIITQAGDFGAITVATNMAGRGCDIIVKEEINGAICDSFVKYVQKKMSSNFLIDIQCFSTYESEMLCDKLREMGIDYQFNKLKGCKSTIQIRGNNEYFNIQLNFGLGLHVIASECCPSRRIEMQLRGRTGRQGNPGSSTLFMSFEDDALVSIPSVRWLGKRTSNWLEIKNNSMITRLFLWMINLATEGEQRFLRNERLFYDTVLEILRKRIVEIRENAIKSDIDNFILLSIRSYIDYLNEDALSINDYEKRISMITLRFQEVFSISDLKSLKNLLDENGHIKLGNERWFANLFGIRKVHISDTEVLNMFCSCIDEMWSTFSDSMVFFQEQANLFAFAGRDPKTTFIDLIFTKWHENVYNMYENFLQKLFILKPDLISKIKITTSSINNEIEELVLT